MGKLQQFSIYGPTPMTIAGDMTLIGTAKVQQGTDGPGVSSDIFIGGNLIIGAGCAWDPSGANLTVVSNVYVYGLLEDLNGALGSNYIGGNVIVAGPALVFPPILSALLMAPTPMVGMYLT